MLVVLAIVTIISAVILVDRGGLNDNLLLKQSIDTVTLAIHRAQVEGLAVLEDPDNIDNFEIGYGVYIESGSDKIVYFVDRNSNGIYDGDIDDIEVGDEATENDIFTLRNANIEDVIADGTTFDTGDAINITYKRPRPDVSFFDNDGKEYSSVIIKMQTTNTDLGVDIIIGAGSEISVERN